jgi:drug/metabolite transporter (DMT)-like permease
LRVTAGLLLGLAGIILIVGPDALAEGRESVSVFGVLVMLGAALAFAAGSLYATWAQLPESVLLATAMQFLTGGAMLLAAAVLTGDLGRFDSSVVSLRSMFSMAYLVVVPGIVAFSAYAWLLRVSTPARVSTYAYVNPVVALFAGWLLGGEDLTRRTVVAAAVIVGGVVLIATQRPEQERESPSSSFSPVE